MYNKERIKIIVSEWFEFKTGIILSDETLSKLVDDITETKQCDIPVVNHRRELLPAFLERKSDGIITLVTAGTDIRLDWEEYMDDSQAMKELREMSGKEVVRIMREVWEEVKSID